MENNQKPAGTLPLIFSALALAGVIVLFVLKFTSNSASPASLPVPAVDGKGHTIAYINTDSLLNNYELVKALSDKQKTKSEAMENQLIKRQNELDKEIEYFQKSVQNKSLSEQSAQEIYQQLMAKQQSIAEQKESFQQEMAIENININNTLVDTLNNFLKRFNKTIGYDYVLGYNKAGNIFLANDTFDITNAVLAELNQEYRAKNANTDK